jgi:hypothetical protein
MITLTKEMFQSGQPIAQGEVVIWMKEFAPQWVKDRANSGELETVDVGASGYILGHSETGHHHLLDRPVADKPLNKVVTALVDKANETFVELRLAEECKIIHNRSGDTHGGYILPAGEYIKISREEQTVDGWQVSRD